MTRPTAASLRCLVLALLAALLAGSPARGIVHLWDVAEIYSNADGSVQFVELFTKGASEIRTQDGRLDSSSASVTLLGPVPLPTTNRSFLVATPGFADLPGAVVPDTVMPVAPFFSVEGDTLVFQVVNEIQVFDTVTFGAGELPLDGTGSLHRVNPGGTSPTDPPGGLVVADNSPSNYAGETGHVTLPEPAPTLLAAATLLATAVLSRHGRRRRG